MKDRFFEQLEQKKFLVFDGAMGTMLLNYGFPGGCSEKLNLENPRLIKKIHREYALAGADVIETNTFGASPLKLAEYGLQDRTEEINIAALKIARSGCDKDTLVAGSVGPLGKLLEPMGEMTFDEAYRAFARQMKALESGGADLLIIETISDVQEMRAALIAAKQETKLPVVCSFTFGPNGKTLSGTDHLTAALTCSALGADVFSTNCGNGPEQLYEMLSPLKKELLKLPIPLMVMPNAGLPELEEGKAVYKMLPEDFSGYTARFGQLGVQMFGGCCGTTPQHIKQLKLKLQHEFQPINKPERDPSEIAFTSRQGHLIFNKKSPFLIIGERLNPTARKAFAAELKEGSTRFLKEEALKQQQEGAQLLDLNVGVPELDQKAAIERSIAILSNICTAPLCLDSDDPAVLETALQNYPGIALVNSVNGKEKSLNTVLPLVKKYGAAVIGLALNEDGIPATTEGRLKMIKKIAARLKKEKIDQNRLFIDALVMAVATDAQAPQITLETIKQCKKLGLRTSLGVSNVSFGLPGRPVINNAFLTLAIKAGLTAGIVNPANFKVFTKETKEFILAKNVLTGRDKGAGEYIKEMKGAAAQGMPVKASPVEKNVLEKIYQAVVEGEEASILGLIEIALKDHSAQEIIAVLIKGIEQVGTFYEKGEYFLPQMVASANAMKKAFQRVKQDIPAAEAKSAGTAVICTVKGDIHDIGKNIVAMMLENHGFRVIDLGKDVPAEVIVKAAIKEKAELVLLSALLTTTMLEMETVKKALAEKKVQAKVMIGGAVVTAGYAERIGAGYSKDAVGAVKLAKELLHGDKQG